MNKSQVKIIDSTYPVEDAKELVLSLINDKIKFLQLKIFSQRERFGIDTKHLEKRISELREERAELIQNLKSFEESDYVVEVDCKIHLKVKKKKRVIA